MKTIEKTEKNNRGSRAFFSYFPLGIKYGECEIINPQRPVDEEIIDAICKLFGISRPAMFEYALMMEFRENCDKFINAMKEEPSDRFSCMKSSVRIPVDIYSKLASMASTADGEKGIERFRRYGAPNLGSTLLFIKNRLADELGMDITKIDTNVEYKNILLPVSNLLIHNIYQKLIPVLPTSAKNLMLLSILTYLVFDRFHDHEGYSNTMSSKRSDHWPKSKDDEVYLQLHPAILKIIEPKAWFRGIKPGEFVTRLYPPTLDILNRSAETILSWDENTLGRS